MRNELLGLVILAMFAVVGYGNTTNSTSTCPDNYYGDSESSPEDLLLRTWCDE